MLFRSVIVGGGVASNGRVFPPLRRELQSLLNGYVKTPEVLSEIDAFVVPPLLGSRAGVLGALALAESLL